MIAFLNGPWSYRSVLLPSTLSSAALFLLGARLLPAETTLRLSVVDAQGQAAPCRVHLKDSAGKPVRPPRHPFWHDHFVCSGSAELDLAPGKYRFEIERGPEFTQVAGEVNVELGQTAEIRAEPQRLINLAARGWWSGDLHVHRPRDDIELLARAEDLHVAPVITWWNARNEWLQQAPPTPTWRRFERDRFTDVMAGEDEREGGALLYFHLDRALPIQDAAREFPPPLVFARQARAQNPGVWIDIEKPFWWDAPVWAASGLADSIGLANNHMCRDQMFADEAWGRARDRTRLPDPHGNGLWSQEIYYHLLNSGVRLPPSAGSASGVLPNPVGYNRVYVQLPGDLDYDAWWEGLRAGRSFVTNGPLLLVRANEQWPGHEFRLPAAGPLVVELDVQLWSRDRVPSVQVIYNGQVIQEAKIDDQQGGRAKLRLTVPRPGWFLVRAITERPETFRFASTGPFHVVGPAGERQVSRRSTQFFIDWVEQRTGRIEANLPDAAQRRAVLADQQTALDFWKGQRAQATDD